MYLLAGVVLDHGRSEPEPSVGDTPLQLVERALAAARADGDPHREAAALADLGLACLRVNEPRRAEAVFQEAHAAAIRIGGHILQNSVAIDRGLAWLDLGRPEEAQGVG